ncbi:CHASE domain-containing protein [Sulfitobacter aestuarii]|uniref:histidine kinase n=1 Tax=Sulfitobacter aestuarii TaxID=2161676 RepID=A0ABW5U4M6_9RHOB
MVLTCLALSGGAYFYAKSVADAAATREFKEMTQDGVKSLQTRFSTYLQSLNGAAAFFNASENVSAVEFDSFVSELDIRNLLPGISGVGFIAPVKAGEEAEFLRRNRGLLHEGFTIHPDTDQPERLIIKFIAPLAANIEALALDIAFEEGRRTTAAIARQTGEPQLTPRILLVQDESKQPGFLLLRPVYDMTGRQADLPASARELVGYVYAPFVGKNLLNGLTPAQGRDYFLAVHDGTGAAPDRLIYQGRPQDVANGRFNAAHQVTFYGRPWTLSYTSTPAFDRAANSTVPLILLSAGLLLTALLAFALKSMRLRGDALAELAAVRARELSAREDENRSIIENAVAAVFILDGTGEILFVNQAGLALFGHTFGEMTGRDFDAFVDRIRDAQEATEGYNATGISKSGMALKLDVQTNSWRAANGSARVTAIVRDVTAELNAHKAVEDTRRRYDLAIAGARIGIFDVDLVAGKSIVSETWHEIMDTEDRGDGFDSQAHFKSRIHPDDLPLVEEADRLCIEGEADRSIAEYRLRFGDEWRWMRSDAVAVERSGTGRAMRLVGAQTDVTDLRHSRNALEASEERFRMVLKEAPVGMALMNHRGGFVLVNDALCALGGYDEAELLGKRIADLLVHEDMKRMYRGVAELEQSKGARSYRGEHQIIAKDGSRRWGLFNVSWTYDKNLQANVFIAQIVDITDQKKMEQVKSEFVSTVSHELRTPLTSIKGALGLIDATASHEIKPAVTRLIEIARTNADRLATIVNDILDLEKISSGEVTFNFESINLSELIDSSITEMLPFAMQHGNKLVVEAKAPDLRIHADASRTKQVLANLISNACKYSSDQTDVVIRIERIKNDAIIFVQNFGPGVPESFKPRIFQAFTQADGSDTRSKGGTGLGLNITRQIVWRQGGNIGFESVAGGPTIFWFTCPVVRSDEQPIQGVGSVQTGGGEPLKILHLEDDLDFAEVIRAGLGETAEVTNVTTLAEMRRTLGRQRMDVCLLDWTVPDGNARSLLDEIAARQPGAKIIGLSAAADRVADTRVLHNMVKSRMDIPAIIQQIRKLAQTSADEEVTERIPRLILR